MTVEGFLNALKAAMKREGVTKGAELIFTRHRDVSEGGVAVSAAKYMKSGGHSTQIVVVTMNPPSSEPKKASSIDLRSRARRTTGGRRTGS